MSVKPKTDPKPIRFGNEWAQGNVLVKITNPEMKTMLEGRSIIVCRECFGFGHSRSKCPTRVKLDRISLMSAAGKSLVGNYRYSVTQKKALKSRSTWLMDKVMSKW